MSDEQHILTSLQEGVLTITMNRPEKKNALTVAMYAGIVAALQRAEDDPQIRVVLWRGTSGIFAAGNDIQDFMTAPPAGPDSPVFQLLMMLVDMKTPIVAAVQGPAVGIGTTGLLHTDMVFADESARFHLPFVNLALCPEGGSSVLLPQVAGMQKASWLLLMGEPFGAEEAERCGIVSEVLPAATFDEEVTRRVRALAQKPAAALRASKELLRGPTRELVKEAMTREAVAFLERLGAPEASEAFTAFLEKRPPDFTQFD